MRGIPSLVALVVGLVGLVAVVEGHDKVGVKSKTLSFASQYFRNIETETLYAQLDFEDDLEVSYDFFCSSQNYKKLATYKSNPGCAPCNYTGPASPDGTCSSKTLNPSLPQFEGLGLPNCKCELTYCQGEVLSAGETPKHYILRDDDLNLVLRYEHTDFDTGFVVKLTPIDEGPVNFLVANALTLDPEHTLAYSYSTAAQEYLKVCPSFNRFGAGSQSITYFIIVLPGDLAGNEFASFDVSVELIPTLEADEEGPYKLLDFWNETATSITNEFNNSPVYLEGTYLSDFYNGSTPAYYPVVIAIPMTECISYSISIEYTHLNSSEFDYFSLIDITTQRFDFEDVKLLTDPSHKFPFKLEEVVEVAYNESKPLSPTAEGKIFSDCPTEGKTTPEYVTVRISAGPSFSDWGLLIFLQETTPDSRTRLNRKLSELPPLVYQRILRPETILSCPCEDPCDKCDTRDAADIRFFNRLSGLTPETFPALTAESVQGCDLAAEIGVPIGDEFLFHCLSYWRDSACGVMRVIPVFESVNPRIYPMPLVIRLLNPFSFSVAPNFFTNTTGDIQTIQDNSVGVLFTIAANGVIYMDNKRLRNKCQLRIGYPTALHNSEDKPPTGEKLDLSSFTNFSAECSEAKFDTISDLLTETTSQLNALTRSGVLVGSEVVAGEDKTAEELFESSSSATYASYSLRFSQEWQSCQALSNSFVVIQEKNESISDSTDCGLNYDETDPCCNTDLQWEICCVPEGREIVVVEVEITSNETQLDVSCEDSSCMETFADDYGISLQEVFFNGICENEFILETGLNRVVSDCTDKWIGNDEFGKLCYTDDDCLDTFETGHCDLSTYRCVEVRKEMELGFLGCLLREVDSVTRSAIANELAKAGAFADATEGFNVTADKLRDYLVGHDECVSDYGPMSHLRARFVAKSLAEPDDQLCPVCYDLYCLSPFGCEWPQQCLDKRELCGATIVPFTSPFCEEPEGDALQCDYNSTLSEEECDLDTPLCLFCHNSSNCVTLPASSESECEDTPLCLLPGGEVLWGVDEDDCEAHSFCSELCEGEACLDEDTCETIGGFCEDSDNILETIELAAKVYPTLVNATQGACVTPIEPFNTPACPYVTEEVIAAPGSFDFRTGNSWDFTTHRGCVVFSNCVPFSIQFADGIGAKSLPQSCDWKPSNITECEDTYKGTWLNLPIQNEMDCENPLKVSDEDFPGFCLEDKTGASPYLSRKGFRDCEECGGVPTKPATWRAGRWLGGLPRKAEWRKPRMVATYHYVADSISFLNLNNLLTLSSANVNSFLNDVAISCGITPFVDYLSLFSCNCADGTADCAAPFEERNLIGGAWLCPAVNSKVGLVVGTIRVNGSDVTGGLCKFSEIALAPAEVFIGNHKRVPLTVLGDPNPIDAEPVRNSNGASVGEVAGDGLQLFCEDTGFVNFNSEIRQLELALFLDTKTLVNFPPHYVFDFGLEVLDDDDKRFSGEIELRPLGAKLDSTGQITQSTTVGELLDTIEDDEVVTLSGYWVDPFLDGLSPRLYPIVRQEDYETEKENDVLSDGEKIMVAIFAALYGLATVCSIAMLFFLFLRAPSLTNLVFSFFIFLAFLFRTIYLSMYASGDLREEDISSFMLVEPPSFFIISVASVLAMSFGFCLHCIKNNVQQEKAFGRFWGYWGLFNGGLYLILILVLLLETQLDIDDTVIISCYGRRAEVEESFTIQAIRIGYHSFLLAIAIVTAFILFSLGSSLESNLQSKSLSHLSIFAGVSVLLSNLLWVIYSGLSGSSPYFVIPLFFVEVPPLLTLMILVLPKEDS